MDYRTLGMLTGLIVGVVVLALIKHFTKSEKPCYDERQIAEQGKCYKFSLLTMLVAAAVIAFVDFAGYEIFTVFIALMSTIVIGAGAFVISAVIKDAYYGLNENRMRMYLLSLFIVLANVLGVFRAFVNGSFMEDGKFSFYFLTLLLVILWIAIPVVTYIHDRMNAGDEE